MNTYQTCLVGPMMLFAFKMMMVTQLKALFYSG